MTNKNSVLKEKKNEQLSCDFIIKKEEKQNE